VLTIVNRFAQLIADRQRAVCLIRCSMNRGVTLRRNTAGHDGRKRNGKPRRLQQRCPERACCHGTVQRKSTLAKLLVDAVLPVLLARTLYLGSGIGLLDWK